VAAAAAAAATSAVAAVPATATTATAISRHLGQARVDLLLGLLKNGHEVASLLRIYSALVMHAKPQRGQGQDSRVAHCQQ